MPGMKSKSIGINGFGRIGRILTRILIENKFDIEFINDPYMSIEIAQNLLENDSVYRKPKFNVFIKNNFLIINNSKKIQFTQKSKLSELSIKNKSIILDCSGHNQPASWRNLKLMPKLDKVFLTCDFPDADQIIIPNVTKQINKKNIIISTSTCDANANLPIIKFLQELVDINHISILLLHPYLNNQILLDGVTSNSNFSDPALFRSAINNLIFRQTSLAKVTANILPDLKNKIYVHQLRTPTTAVAGAQIIINGKHGLSKEKLVRLLSKQKFCELNNKQLTSQDFIGTKKQAVIDVRGLVVTPNSIELFIWYDNEYGYAYQLFKQLKEYVCD